mgnify:CR=1 FL=1
MTTPMHWARWGDPSHASALPESAAGLIDAVFGTDEKATVALRGPLSLFPQTVFHWP